MRIETLLTRATGYLLTLDPDLTVSRLQILLVVAQGQDVLTRDISRKTGLAISSITRSLGQLGDKPQRGVKQGLGLVDVRPDPDDSRRVFINLSPKGRKVIEDLQNMQD